MASLEFFVIAQSVSVDQETNSLSVFHVPEELASSALPMLVPKLTAVSVWLLPDNERGNDFQVSLIVKKPDGTELHRFDHNFTATTSRQRMLTHVQHVPFDQAGEWVFEIRLNGAHAANHRVTVRPPDPNRLGDLTVSLGPPGQV